MLYLLILVVFMAQMPGRVHVAEESVRADSNLLVEICTFDDPHERAPVFITSRECGPA